MIKLRPAATADEDAVWAMLEPVIRVGETCTFPRDMPRDAALSYWQADAHVCNCAFIASSTAKGFVDAFVMHRKL